MPDDHAEEQQRFGGNEQQQAETQAQREPQMSERDDSAQQSEKTVEAARPNAGPAGEAIRVVSQTERKRMNRRELLKLVPLLAVAHLPSLSSASHSSTMASTSAIGPQVSSSDGIGSRRPFATATSFLSRSSPTTSTTPSIRELTSTHGR